MRLAFCASVLVLSFALPPGFAAAAPLFSASGPMTTTFTVPTTGTYAIVLSGMQGESEGYGDMVVVA